LRKAEAQIRRGQYVSLEKLERVLERVLAKEAERQFEKLPADRQQLILKHLKLMQADPFQGDVKALRVTNGKAVIASALQVPDYLSPAMAEQIVDILLILPRTEKTYR